MARIRADVCAAGSHVPIGTLPELFIQEQVHRLPSYIRPGLLLVLGLDFTGRAKDWDSFASLVVFLTPVQREMEPGEDESTGESFICTLLVPEAIKSALRWIEGVNFDKRGLPWLILLNITVRRCPTGHSPRLLLALVSAMNWVVASWECVYPNDLYLLLNHPFSQGVKLRTGHATCGGVLRQLPARLLYAGTTPMVEVPDLNALSPDLPILNEVTNPGADVDISSRESVPLQQLEPESILAFHGSPSVNYNASPVYGDGYEVPETSFGMWSQSVPSDQFDPRRPPPVPHNTLDTEFFFRSHFLDTMDDASSSLACPERN